MIFLALTVGCSNDFECELPIDNGTWKITYNEVSGTCGPLENELIQYPVEDNAGCFLTKHSLDENECKLQRTVECAYDGVYSEGVLSITQFDTDFVAGQFDIWISIPTYGYSCSGIYEISLERL